MEKAPAGITGSFNMLFVMVFRRFPEKFSFGIFSPFQNPMLFAYHQKYIMYLCYHAIGFHYEPYAYNLDQSEAYNIP